MLTKLYLVARWIGFSIAIGMVSLNSAHAVNFDHTKNFDFSNPPRGQEIGCLAMNIYHEGRGESPKGRAAIAAVTMNRVSNPDYPDTVCEVVWQRKQFSWTQIAARHHVIRNFESWDVALTTARLFLDGAKLWKIGHATHYHAENVEPYWASTQTLVGKVGSHYFYTL
ncbi:MAG: hypothetical protein GKR95_14980 [Gammaproteobacteria bacterium]|nr:hypothetical protein [Gammaproteobacteria bacterium]